MRLQTDTRTATSAAADAARHGSRVTAELVALAARQAPRPVGRAARMEVVAHRGHVADGRPENTLAAVHAAFDRGADGVEVDVRLSADGVLLCSHGAEAVSPDGQRLGLARHSAAELRRLDLGGGHRLPTLAEVLEAVRSRGGRVVVELKAGDEVGYAARVRRAIHEVLPAWSTTDVTCSSFDDLLLGAVSPALAALGVRTALLGAPETSLTALLARALRGGHHEIHPSLASVLRTPEALSIARRLGVAVTAWTVNEPGDLLRVNDLGADAVITDNPFVARLSAGRPAPGRAIGRPRAT